MHSPWPDTEEETLKEKCLAEYLHWSTACVPDLILELQNWMWRRQREGGVLCGVIDNEAKRSNQLENSGRKRDKGARM